MEYVLAIASIKNPSEELFKKFLKNSQENTLEEVFF